MAEERNPFETTADDLPNVMDALYGSTEGLKGESGRVVVRPVALDAIWADVKQPRRAIPASIRNNWDGDPQDVPDMLAQWYVVACQAGGQMDLVAALMGQEGSIPTPQASEEISTPQSPPRSDREGKLPAVWTEWVALVRLAADIHAIGLTNPITVIEQSEHRLIETGERRWLAFHLLKLYVDAEQYAKIPAAVSDGKESTWRQASENTARRSLNAIGMARQIALLIMAARGDTYQEYADLVQPGGCDRRFYAQVADGVVHRIPEGMGERIQAAMGLSRTQISQYRRLLRLTDDEDVNDALWLRADVEDWAELAMRQIVGMLTEVNIREIVIGRKVWTLDDLRAEVERVRKAANGLNPDVREGSYAGQLPQRPMEQTPIAGRPASPFDRHNVPQRDEPEEMPFEIGEAVMDKHTQEVGEVQSMVDGRVLVLVDGEMVSYPPARLISTGMTMLEYMEEELAHGGEVETEAQPLENYYEERDFTPVTALRHTERPRSDKADSQGEDVELVLPPGSPEQRVMVGMMALASAMHDQDLARMLDQLEGLTETQAALMGDGEIAGMAEMATDAIATAMNGEWWEAFESALQMLVDAGE